MEQPHPMPAAGVILVQVRPRLSRHRLLCVPNCRWTSLGSYRRQRIQSLRVFQWFELCWGTGRVGLRPLQRAYWWQWHSLRSREHGDCGSHCIGCVDMIHLNFMCDTLLLLPGPKTSVWEYEMATSRYIILCATLQSTIRPRKPQQWMCNHGSQCTHSRCEHTCCSYTPRVGAVCQA